MSCSRCQGLMVAETLFNPSEGGTHTWVAVIRCLNCGNLEDGLIRMARCLPDHFRRSTRPGPRRGGAWGGRRAGAGRQLDEAEDGLTYPGYGRPTV